jgi:hypothetical protein
MKKCSTYKFNIINLIKNASLFNDGMRPLMYSSSTGWVRCGYDICYYQNHYKRGNGYYYTLTWTFDCNTDDDMIYFAHCYPYTYTTLQRYLSDLDARKVKREILATSLGSRHCDLLTITSFHDSDKEIAARKGVILSARVHPGETNASWMMKGALDFLISEDPEAIALRKAFVFKIVPMLNPDGVVCGNYRCDLTGADMNRKFDNPDPTTSPIVYNFKKMVKEFIQERPVQLYCDFHGHSKQRNIFMYGCIDRTDHARNIEIQVFPKLCSQISSNFSFNDCSFNLDDLKLNTGRVNVFTEMSIMNSFTMEASFCGADQGPNADYHFSTCDLEQMGKDLLKTLLVYHNDQKRVDLVRKQLLKEYQLSSKL